MPQYKIQLHSYCTICKMRGHLHGKQAKYFSRTNGLWHQQYNAFYSFSMVMLLPYYQQAVICFMYTSSMATVEWLNKSKQEVSSEYKVISMTGASYACFLWCGLIIFHTIRSKGSFSNFANLNDIVFHLLQIQIHCCKPDSTTDFIQHIKK